MDDNLPENFSILSAHRRIPPAMEALLEMGEVKIDGFIDPGHVSTIIGMRPYEALSRKYGIPQVIAGFEPLDVMMSVYMIARQLERGEGKVENEYKRAVKEEGNKKALKKIEEVFEPMNIKWRGLPEIPLSGLKPKKEYEGHDAEKLFEDDLEELEEDISEPEGCRCGEVLRGLIYSEECPLFGKKCTPEHPVGPCMVSKEGSCNILFKHGHGKVNKARSRMRLRLRMRLR